MGGDRGRPVLIVTPYSLESNPYIRLLTESLRAGGLRVELARGTSPILLWRSFRRFGRPRVVHLQWHHPYLTDGEGRRAAAVVRTMAFFAQWAFLRALGVRFVWTVHNLVGHERQQARWELFACRILARMVDALVAHCEVAAGEVAAAYRIPVERVRVVPHGLVSLPGAPDRVAARAGLGVAEDRVLLLNFGRIRPYKGIDRLIEAFRAAAGPDMELAVVGFPDDPELAAGLERRVEADPRIRLRFEEVGDEELNGLLSACDAVVLPYRDSLTSGAAVLAGSHGRPVIAPRLGCLREWPEDGGVLYDDEARAGGRADGLEGALERAAHAPLATMGEAARRYVERYPWERVAERTEQVYRAVTGGGAAARAGL